jgi:hypothetical protein
VSKSIDPQLPYIQVARGVAAKAAQLAARCQADYYRVRGVLDCFWEELADRRVLLKAIQGPGCVVVTLEQAEAGICKPIGASIADVIQAGFLEARPDGYRVRGMSRYLDAERLRLGRKGGSTPLRPPFDPPATPPPVPLQGGSEATDVRRETRDGRRKTEGEEEAPPPPVLKVVEPEDPLATLTPAQRHQQLEPPDASRREDWTRQDFWRWAQCARRDRARLVVEKWPNDVTFRAWWGDARALASVDALQAAFVTFGDDSKWQRATPPLPFAAFMSQFTNYLPQGAAHAAR